MKRHRLLINISVTETMRGVTAFKNVMGRDSLSLSLSLTSRELLYSSKDQSLDSNPKLLSISLPHSSINPKTFPRMII